MIREKIIEQQNSKRYKATEGAYAAISPNLNQLGPITDISVGGVCFKYIDNGILKNNLSAINLKYKNSIMNDLAKQTKSNSHSMYPALHMYGLAGIAKDIENKNFNGCLSFHQTTLSIIYFCI
jgi:hypothetical protein